MIGKKEKRLICWAGSLLALAAFLLFQPGTQAILAHGGVEFARADAIGDEDEKYQVSNPNAITPSDFQARPIDPVGLAAAVIILGVMSAMGVVMGRRRLLDSEPKK